MPGVRKQSFDHLSADERAVVGAADDYDWAGATTVAGRSRPNVTQFSLRVDRELLGHLQALAPARGVTVTDGARISLARDLRARVAPAVA